MDIKLKAIVVIIGLFFVNTSQAGVLCDSNCNLIIDFPTGGAIEAIDPVTITFGNGGLLDTASSVTAYVEGETVTLGAGEALVFENGGSFNIGDSGNINFTNLTFNSGVISLSAAGGSE